MPKRVLLADDSRAVREAARVVFESAGFVCDEAENGAKAIERASAVHPDLIVLDLAMPTMNGLQAAPLLRKMLPLVPIILFTLYAGAVLEEQARDAGITCVVGKDQPATNLLKQAQLLMHAS